MNFPRKIYAIQHNITKRIYIGSSAKPETRYRHHIQNLRNGEHNVELMQSDFDEYGENYSFFILDEITTILEKEKEYRWMRMYRTYDRAFGYNYKDRTFVSNPEAIPLKTGKPSFPWGSEVEKKPTDKQELLSFLLNLTDEEVDKIIDRLSRRSGDKDGQ